MKKTIISFVTATIILCASGSGIAQKIRTIAGNTTEAYTGDGSQAIHASIGSSQGIATDQSGNIYISDNDVNVVRKIAPNGIISTIAGTGAGYGGYSGDGGPATNALLLYPTGLATDASGNLYIADNGNYCIRKVDTRGVITTVVGDGSRTWGFAGDGGPATAARLNGCVAVAVDKSGNLFIADGNSRVRKVDASGTITTVAGTGALGYTGEGAAATAADLYNPSGVAADTSGNIYIADQANNVIRKVNSAGIISTVAGNTISGYSGDGGAATNAKINAPAGISTDSKGNIYFTDQGNNCIRKILPSGIITTVTGNGTTGFSGDGAAATNAALNAPVAIDVDDMGNIFIADRMNYVVREVINRDLFTISSNAGSNAIPGSSVTFTAPAAYGYYGMSFQWQLNGANTGLNNIEYTNSALNNNDVITCQLVDQNTGIDYYNSNSITMNITSLATPVYPSAVTGFNIAMMPNPNNGSFRLTGNLSSTLNGAVDARIYDMLGRLVYDNELSAINRRVDDYIVLDNAQPAGKYVLVLTHEQASQTISFQINK